MPRQAHHFAAGTMIFEEGEKGGDVYLIRSGEVEVFRKQNNREITLAVLEKDELLGVMTATTGAPRTASARAQSDVQAVLVTKAELENMLAGMPKWGLALIKDLIARVEYCDSLYIEQVQAAEGRPVDDPLGLAATVTSSLTPVLNLMAQTQKLVTLDDLTAKMGEILGVSAEQLRGILQIFMDSGILAGKEGSGPGSFDRKSAAKLSSFGAFIRDIRARAAHQDTALALLNVGEREALLGLAEKAEKHAKNSETPSEFSLSTLAAEAQKNGGKPLDNMLIDRAVALGYMQKRDASGQIMLSFSPLVLATTLRYYDVAKRLDPRAFAVRRLKKTMLY